MRREDPEDFKMRGTLLETCREKNISLDMIAKIVRPMRGKTPEEKEAIAEKILMDKFNISREQIL